MLLKTELIEKQLRESLYVENEYGYAHQHAGHPNYTRDQLEYLKQHGLKTEYHFSPTTVVPIHPMCMGCQARHILKYKNHANVKDGLPFKVKCNGVPGILPKNVKDSIARFATEKDVDIAHATRMVKASIDPVTWAELMFGFSEDREKWKLRWYQREQLRCTAPRMVIRMGRRSGKTFLMSLKLLYFIFNMLILRGYDQDGKELKTGPHIIIVTPFQAQLINVFNEIESLLKTNADLSAKVVTSHAGSLYVKSPFFRMEFENGGSISGFVTGVEVRQDGSGAGSLRGQSSDIIYLDEMDMIQADVLDKVIIPILATREETMFFATSTPIGKAGKFFDLANNRPDFIETYLPSTVLPHWESFKPELEYADPTDDAFISEYMAHFIESSTGVFKAKNVYSAMKDYTYEDSRPDNLRWWNHFAQVVNPTEMFSCIGIDWNKNAGSEFVVVKYDPMRNWWWVAESVNVAAGQFSSMRFKEEVIRLNYKWQPNYIYADEGYGHHIIDDLLWEAHRLQISGAKDLMDQHTAKLKDRLKRFNFSGKVDLSDPVRGTVFQRTGKDFLVENTIRVLELDRFSYPSNDKVMRAQLLNYIVLRRNQTTNKPVYGMKQDKLGDHRLDALMLALGGLFLEKNPLYSTKARTITSEPGLVKKEELERRKQMGEIEDKYKLHKGLTLEYLHINRGAGPDDHNRIMELQNLSQRNASEAHSPWGNERDRGEFPTTGDDKPASVFEDLWARSKSSNGFDTDTRALYENRPRKNTGPSSGMFVLRKQKRSSRGSR